MTKYRVIFEPCAPQGFGPYGLYSQDVDEHFWNYCRSFPSLEVVDQFIKGIKDTGDKIVREFEIP